VSKESEVIAEEREMQCPERVECPNCCLTRDIEQGNICWSCGYTTDNPEPCPGCPACGGRGYLNLIPEEVSIIGLCGKVGQGKDYIADNFLKPNGYYPIAFADVFKHRSVGIGWMFEDIFEDKPPAARDFLQKEGTERGRDIHGRQLWLRALESFILKIYRKWGISGFVITDVRFKNEIRWVKSLGGLVGNIESDRPTLGEEAAQHVSEKEMEDVDPKTWDFTYINNMDTENGHLHKQTDHLMRLIRQKR